MTRPLPTKNWPLLPWGLAFVMAQWSVVQYRLSIVVVYTGAAVLLAFALLRRWPRPDFHRISLVVALLAAGIAAEFVPFFSHSSPQQRAILGHILGATSLGAALLLLLWPRRGPALAAGWAALGTCAWTATSIIFVPEPRIDVWLTLQQAADGLAEGKNPYTMMWVGSPGVSDAFTYLPWTAVLLAPGRWLAGDVRWSLLVCTLIALSCLIALGRPGTRQQRSAALAAMTLLACAPGTITQAEQAWTEPLLLACLATWALLVQRNRAWWAIIPLALGCASKQHLALVLPLLACWAGFGWRRTLATGTLSGVLISPWLLANPQEMIRDTVTFLVEFHPILFANTWFIASLTELGRTPPVWLTGGLVGGTLVASCWLIRRRQPELSTVIAWLALVLFLANLANKQAFYNQFWLIGGLLALSYAALAQPSRDGLTGQQGGQPGGQIIPAPALRNPCPTSAAEASCELPVQQ